MKGREALANDLFGSTIGLGYWSSVALRGHVKRGVIEPLKRERARIAKDFDSVVEHREISGGSSHPLMLTRQRAETLARLRICVWRDRTKLEKLREPRAGHNFSKHSRSEILGHGEFDDMGDSIDPEDKLWAHG